jgi:hypothetical protein
VVPQAFDKRYFTLKVMAPYSEARDAHLYTHLLYPADVNRLFLSEFTDLVTRFTDTLIDRETHVLVRTPKEGRV